MAVQSAEGDDLVCFVRARSSRGLVGSLPSRSERTEDPVTIDVRVQEGTMIAQELSARRDAFLEIGDASVLEHGPPPAGPVVDAAE